MKKQFLTALALSAGILTTNAQVFEWANQQGGSQNDVSRSVALDANGNSYVIGDFYNTMDLDPGAGVANVTAVGGADVFLAKYDPNGAYLWGFNIGSAGDDRGMNITLDNTDQPVICGYFAQTFDADPSAATVNLSNSGGNDGFVAKYDAAGNYLWAYHTAGANEEYVTDVVVGAADQVFAVGRFSGNNCYFNPTGPGGAMSATFLDGFIVEINSGGNYVGRAGIQGAANEYPERIHLDASGYLWIGGYFEGTVDFDVSILSTQNRSSAGNKDAFITKMTDALVYQGVWTMGGPNDDRLLDMDIDAAGNVVITGMFSSLNADFDPQAGSQLFTAGGARDAFLMKYNLVMAYQWGYKIGSTATNATGEEWGYAVSFGNGGDIFLGGSYAGSVNFNPTGVGPSDVIGNNGVTDGFVSKYTSAGAYAWTRTYGEGATDDVRDIQTEPTGNSIFAAGRFGDASVQFDEEGGAGELSAVGGADGFLTKLGNCDVVEFDTHPSAVQVGNGLPFDMTVAVHGQAPFTYQWYLDGNAISGATSATYSVASATNADAGDYHCMVSNACGTYSSDTANAFVQILPEWQWVEGFGNTNQNERARKVVTDAAGNIYVAFVYKGVFWPQGFTVSPSATGTNDFGVMKMDPSGNIQWITTAGNTAEDYALGLCLDGNGDVVVSGYFTGNVVFGSTTLSATGSYDGFVASLDASVGAWNWATRMGGTGNDIARGVAFLDEPGTANDKIIAVGDFSGLATFGANSATSLGSRDAFIAQLNPSTGTITHVQSFGSTSDDIGTTITTDGSDVYVAGYYKSFSLDFGGGHTIANTNSSYWTAWYTRYNLDGSVDWAQTGYCTRDQVVLDLEVHGNRLYACGYHTGAATYGSDIFPQNNTTEIDLYITQMDRNSGAFNWTVNSGGHSNVDRIYGIEGYGDEIFATGSFRGGPFNLGSTILTTTSNFDHIFAAKIDTTGNWRWADAATNDGFHDAAYDIALNNEGYATIVGYYRDSPTFGSINSPFVSTTETMFVASWGACTQNCPPDNEACADAESLTVSSYNQCNSPSSGTTLNASQDGPTSTVCAATSGGGDVWYTFNSGSNTSVIINLENTGAGSASYAVYTGTCGAFAEVDCGSSLADATVSVSASTDYYVRIYSDAGQETEFEICVQEAPCGVSAPEITGFTNLSHHGTTVQWASADLPAGGEFIIRYHEFGNSPNFSYKVVPIETANSAYVNGLSPNTRYVFRVGAKCGAQTAATYSDTASVWTKKYCPKPTNLMSTPAATSATVSWDDMGADSYKLRFREVGTANWRYRNTTLTTAQVGVLTPSTQYEWQIRAICNSGGNRRYTALENFSTPSVRLSPSESISQFNLYPNPTTGSINVQFELDTEAAMSIEVKDMSGRLVARNSNSGSTGFNQMNMELTDLPMGVYVLQLFTEDRQSIVTERVIKR